MRAAFDALLEGVSRDDTLLIGMSGHGVQLFVGEGDARKETPFFCPRDAVDRSRANFDSELGRTCEVGSFARAAPHPWGLCDMTGNVAECCANVYEHGQKYCVLRGGSFDLDASFCRAACRGSHAPADRYSSQGFRLVFRPQ